MVDVVPVETPRSANPRYLSASADRMTDLQDAQATYKRTILRCVERSILQRDIKTTCVVMTAIAVAKSIFFVRLFALLLGVTLPPVFLQIVVLAAICVSAPLVFYSVGSIHRLKASRRAVRAQAQTLDQRNADLARAERALRETNGTLERRVSERTQLLEKARITAEESNTAKSRFLANMSHELRTPLNAIIGFSDLMMNRREIFDKESDLRVDEYSDAVNTAGTHLLSLVNDLLDLSRIECGRFDITPEALCIEEVVRNAVQSLTPQAAQRKTVITVHNACTGRFVRADARAANQILVNLLSNALKFSPDNSVIRLDVEDDAQGTTFTVTDRGMGMAPEDAQAAIRPFARLSEAHIASGESIGLGLSIVDALCTLHGGSLELSSEKDHGTVARIRFPLHADMSACTEPLVVG